jgi:hypothetical protein
MKNLTHTMVLVDFATTLHRHPFLENLDHPSVLLTTWDSIKVLVLLLPIDLCGATGLPYAHIKDVVLNWLQKNNVYGQSRCLL